MDHAQRTHTTTNTRTCSFILDLKSEVSSIMIFPSLSQTRLLVEGIDSSRSEPYTTRLWGRTFGFASPLNLCVIFKHITFQYHLYQAHMMGWVAFLLSDVIVTSPKKTSRLFYSRALIMQIAPYSAVDRN